MLHRLFRKKPVESSEETFWILGAYSKVPQKSVVSSSKSEFEELEAVPTMALMDGPLEPSSSMPTNTTDIPDDPAFVNFFSTAMLQTAMNIGNASNATVQPYQSSTTIPPPSQPPSVTSSLMPALQVPSPRLSSSNPQLPLLDNLESNSSSNQATNLVKPSSFFVPPSTTARSTLPVSSSMPTAPPLNPPLNLQRPYGAPLLQPFPPPTPPPSLTPILTPNYGQVISKDKVRDALLTLVQDNQFIDMVYRAMLNAHHS